PVPSVNPLNERLAIGGVILIHGHPSPNANFFAIALQNGPSNNFSDDVALYLSSTFTPPARIIRNSLIYNQWGPEESFGGQPLLLGQPFEIMILVESSEYKIAINKQHFTEFKHRLPFDRITHLAITGEVQIDSVSIWYNPNNPQPSTGFYPPLPTDPIVGYGGAPYPTNEQALPSQYGPPYPPPPPYEVGNYNNPYHPSMAMGTPQVNPSYPDQTNKKSGGIGNMIGSAIAGVTGGAAANAIGSKIFGGGNRYGQRSIIPGFPGSSSGGCNQGGYPKKHKKSSAIPIAGLAAGAGAAALGAALLSKPIKKAFKHKHHKHWGHGSSSSSSSEEE
ncbi:galectin-like protein 4, partial [Sarcoptes scabiei]